MGEYLEKEKESLQKRTDKSRIGHSIQSVSPHQASVSLQPQKLSESVRVPSSIPVMQRKLKVPDEIPKSDITKPFIQTNFGVAEEEEIQKYRAEVITLIESDLEHPFANWNAVKKYIDDINQHIMNMRELTTSTSYTYNNTPASNYLDGIGSGILFPTTGAAATKKTKLNCWSAVLHAAIGVNGMNEESVRDYAKSKEIDEDPVLRLMENATKMDISALNGDTETPAKTAIKAEIRKIPKGYIIALDNSGDRRRNQHVFVCVGNGRALEYDNVNKGERDILEIRSGTYKYDTILWYVRPPWLS